MEAGCAQVRSMQLSRSACVLSLFRAASTAVMPASPPEAWGAAAGAGFPRASNKLPAAGGGGGGGPAGRLGAPADRRQAVQAVQGTVERKFCTSG